MIVAIVWGAAVLAALIILAVAGLELFGHLKRLNLEVGRVRRELLPGINQVTVALTERSARGDQEAADTPERRNDSGQPAAGAGRAAVTGHESTLGGPGRHRANP